MPNLRFRLFSAFAALALFFPAATRDVSAQVVIGAGSSWSGGDALIDWGCDDVIVDGTLNVQAATTQNADSVQINAVGVLNGGTGTLGLTGDFVNQGAFNQGTGRVAIRDGCGNAMSRIAGSQNFFALDVQTTSAKELQFTAGSTTTIGNLGMLTLAGTNGNLLKIRSTVPGSAAHITLHGGQNIHHVDVADNHSNNFVLAPGVPSASGSVNSGNIMNWFDVVFRVPTLSAFGLILLALGLFAFAWRSKRLASPSSRF